jgi:hypothetical protein
MNNTNSTDSTNVLHSSFLLPSLVTREKWATLTGLPLKVLINQCDKGYWPQVTVGKRVFLNVEAVRIAAAKKAQEFTL